MPQGSNSEWIPNIIMGQDYDQRYRDEVIHYDELSSLADFFGRDMSVHRHAQHLQLHYIDSGLINFHIDQQVYQVNGPSLFLTPPSVPHSFHTEAHAGGHVLTIHQSLVWQLLRSSGSKTPALEFNQGVCLCGDTLDTNQRVQWEQIQQLWNNIRFEWNSDNQERLLALESYVRLLFINIRRLSLDQAQSTQVNSEDLRIYNLFTSEIEDHFRDNWLLPNYIDKIGVSETRLNQVCQKISNSPPKRIIRERVLQEIKRMLVFSRRSLNEIAFDLGFSDPAYFSRFFKKHTGSSPLNYRKEHG